MSMVKQVSYIGKGRVFIRNRSLGKAKIVPLGNVSALDLKIAEEKKELKDYENPGGGTLDSVSLIKGVTGTCKTSNHNPANLALALRGSIASLEGEVIADEAHADVQRGSLLKVARMLDTTQTVTLKKGATPIVAAGNYSVNSAGLWIEADATNIVDDDELTVSYTALAENVIQALVKSGDEYELIFSGLNEARSNKPVIVTLHRITFDPTKALSLIADSFGSLDIDVNVLMDDSIVGDGVSKYFTVRQAA